MSSSQPIFFPGSRLYWLQRLADAMQAKQARDADMAAQHVSHVHFAVQLDPEPVGALEERELVVAIADREEQLLRLRSRLAGLRAANQARRAEPPKSMDALKAWAQSQITYEAQEFGAYIVDQHGVALPITEHDPSEIFR